MKQLYLVLVALILRCYSFGQVLTYKQDILHFRSENWKSLMADPRTTLHPQDSMYLDYFPIKERNKVYANVVPVHEQDTIEMPTYSGKIKSFKKYALIQFRWKNNPVTLTAYQSLQNMNSPIYKDYLFIPFKDKTTGKSTYAGGRYIDVKPGQIQQGHLILDLNEVYNPWCAYSDGYNCPIPPKENTLNISLTAGERKFKKAH
jgi:uncharacterized protein (DUF1684 family)